MAPRVKARKALDGLQRRLCPLAVGGRVPTLTKYAPLEGLEDEKTRTGGCWRSHSCMNAEIIHYARRLLEAAAAAAAGSPLTTSPASSHTVSASPLRFLPRRKYDAFSLTPEGSAEVARLESPSKREQGSSRNGVKGMERRNEARRFLAAALLLCIHTSQRGSQGSYPLSRAPAQRWRREEGEGGARHWKRSKVRKGAPRWKTRLPERSALFSARTAEVPGQRSTKARREEEEGERTGGETNMRIPYTKDSATSNQSRDEMKGRGSGRAGSSGGMAHNAIDKGSPQKM